MPVVSNPKLTTRVQCASRKSRSAAGAHGGPKGPHAPQRAFLGPLGPQGPLRGHRGTQGEPPEPPRGSGSIFGTPRILASRRPPGDLPAAGLPAALPAWRRPLEAWRRPALGILADELARFCDMAGFFEAWRRLWPDFERPGGGLAAAAAWRRPPPTWRRPPALV